MKNSRRDIRTKEVPICFICKSKGIPLYTAVRDHLSNAPDTWDFFKCPKCGLVWLNPRPIPKDIKKVYMNYRTHSMMDKKIKTSWLRKKIKNALLATVFGYSELLKGQSYWRKWIGKFASLISLLKERAGFSIMYLYRKQKGRLLDVGSGNGWFLDRMRELGWEVIGVEPDAKAAEITQEKFDVQVFVGETEDADFAEDSFDAVTMSHVIEHVPYPLNLLEECYRILKPNGILVIVTPNIESLGHKIFRQFWRGLEPSRHFNLFSMQTLQICAKRVGFHTEILRSLPYSACWIWAASKFNKSGFGNFSKNYNGVLKTQSILFRFFEYLEICLGKRNTGEELLLIASKNSKL